jgi:hypothetical protein
MLLRQLVKLTDDLDQVVAWQPAHDLAVHDRALRIARLQQQMIRVLRRLGVPSRVINDIRHGQLPKLTDEALAEATDTKEDEDEAK